MAKHHALVDRELVRLVNGSLGKRLLLILEPPRHGKSTQMSVWFPAWYLGHFPDREVMLQTHGSELSTDLGRKARDAFALVAGEIFGTGLDPEKSAAHNWRTLHGGGMRTSGVGGSQTGRGANLLILDDLIKNAEEAQSETYRDKTWEWIVSTAWFRLEPGGICVVGATPWQRNDYLARIKRGELTESFQTMSFPAVIEKEVDKEIDSLGRSYGEVLWPERWPMCELEEKKASAYYWAAEFQLRPSQYEKAEWPEEYFERIWCDYWPRDKSLTIVALDPSLGKTDKADYSAFVAVAKGHDGCYYVDADISRRPSQCVVDDGVEWMRGFRPDAFGCETNQFQELLRSMFETALPRAGLTMSRVFGINNTLPKIVRIRLLTPLLAAGRIKVRRGSEGGKLLVEQLRDFPFGDYDDGPDALEMAIRLCEELLQGSGREEREEVLIA